VGTREGKPVSHGCGAVGEHGGPRRRLFLSYAAMTPKFAKREPKRLTFACVQCGEGSDAPPETKRSDQKLCRRCFGKRKDVRPRDLNDLTGAEWARFSKSIESYPDTRTDKQRQHGACFPKSLASQQIQIFTKRGETVLDPFVGVGTTLDAAEELSRRGIGIELNPKFARLAIRDLKRSGAFGRTQRVIIDDARRLTSHVKKNSVDFILTSPPYGTLLKSVKGDFAYKWREHSTLDPISNPRPYSLKSQDLGNMPYDDFMVHMQDIMAQCLEVLREEAYAVWVVKDYRDLKHNVPYVNFHADMISVGVQAGFTLRDIRIFDQSKFRPLVCLGFPSRNFYLNIGHSYLLVFKKQTR
jgi:DNA modification methylase